MVHSKSSAMDIQIDTTPATAVKEGEAEIQFSSSLDVFYNPVQEFNRDLSIAVLRLYAMIHAKYQQNIDNLPKRKQFLPHLGQLIKEKQYKVVHENQENDMQEGIGLCLLPPNVKHEKGIHILEALAASGLRSIRFAREVGGIEKIVANDLSSKAVECMEHNILHNHVQHIVQSSHNDASMVMYQNREPKTFHAIDLDPYGSPHLFLDGAVQCVIDGGILLVTCTDMAVLCGNSPETCYTKYGALSINSKSCHEIALRIVLQCIESHANRYGRHIVPLLSISADFYVRLVVQVFTSQNKCKETFSKLSYIYQCNGCDTTTLQPLGNILVNGKSIKYQLSTGPSVSERCVHCGHRHLCAGPIWSEPIHDKSFVSLLKASLVEKDFKTYRRLYGTLTMVEEELTDVPLYYIADKLASKISTGTFKMREVRSAILNGGYRVSMSHARKNSIKTDAPPQFIWDLMRAWEKLNPVKRIKIANNDVAKAILDKKSENEISFQLHPDADPDSKKLVLLRFQVNPEKNWGPKQRSKTSLFHQNMDEKKERNQGKKKRKKNVEDEESKKIKENC